MKITIKTPFFSHPKKDLNGYFDLQFLPPTPTVQTDLGNNSVQWKNILLSVHTPSRSIKRLWFLNHSQLLHAAYNCVSTHPSHLYFLSLISSLQMDLVFNTCLSILIDSLGAQWASPTLEDSYLMLAFSFETGSLNISCILINAQSSKEFFNDIYHNLASRQWW